MAIQIQLRRGTASQWTTANTLLAQGEIGLETDTSKLKLGDGSTLWNSLSYFSAGSGVTDVTATSPVASSGGLTPVISLSSGYGDTLNPYASKTANYVLATPNGSAGVPTFRAIVATDIPTLNQNTTGNSANVTGTVAVANGGTGSTTASGARTNLSAASSGSNTDITSIALTTGTVSTAPSSSTDIVNKSYADSIASGVNFHAACNYATTATLGTVTYNNGTAGVGATLTNGGTQAALTIDGYTFTGTDVTNATRVLVKNQTTQTQNGVYIVTNQGSASTNWVLTRATDYDTSGSGTNEIDIGDLILVISGTANSNTSWVQQTPLPITVGTTNIVFIQFAAIQTYTAGTGLSLSTNQFSITNVGTANTYGSSTTIPVLTTNAQGQVTAVTNTAIGTLNQNTTGSAATLTTGRTLAITGDLAYTSPSFDGSANVTATGTLATVNTNVGSFTNATLTVNGKGLITAASSGTAPVTSVTATSPVASTGGATPDISMPAATTSVSGYLTSTDWTTFNSKGSGTVTSVAALTLGTTGTDLSSSVATGTTTPVITLNVPTASATNRGVLSSADWTTFNNKGSGTVTSVTGTSPVVSSGGTTPAISMAAATASVNGYLTSTDWTTFNNKGSGTVTSVAATVPSFLSVTGSPITTSGTLAITLSGTALPIANGGTGATTLAGASITTYSGTETLTNKRIDPRVTSAASASSLTPSIATADVYAYTALAANLTINAPTGTPVDGDKLIFRLLDNGTTRTLTWDATYTVIGVTLPTSTTANKTSYVGCIYNANNTRWDVIAVTTQA